MAVRKLTSQQKLEKANRALSDAQAHLEEAVSLASSEQSGAQSAASRFLAEADEAGSRLQQAQVLLNSIPS